MVTTGDGRVAHCRGCLWLALALGASSTVWAGGDAPPLDTGWEDAVEHVLQVSAEEGGREEYEVARIQREDLVDVVVVRHLRSDRRWSFETPGKAWLHHPPRDYDGDGSTELLASEGAGGTCCPPRDVILGIVDGEPVRVAFPESGFDTGELRVEWDARGARFVRIDVDGRSTFRWRGGRIERVEHLPPLATLAQIEGSGERWQDGAPRLHALAFDLDGDGVEERIECTESTRFGNLEDCALPVPGSAPQVLDVACSRLGVLAERSQGMHVLVCDALTTLRFDGRVWR